MFSIGIYLGGCGTWVESSGEEDEENSNSNDRGDGGVNNDMGDPNESIPLPDGFEFIDPPEDESIDECSPSSLEMPEDDQQLGTLRFMLSADGAISSAYEIRLPDLEVLSDQDISMDQVGEYRVKADFTSDVGTESCVVYFSLSQEIDDMSYVIGITAN